MLSWQDIGIYQFFLPKQICKISSSFIDSTHIVILYADLCDIKYVLKLQQNTKELY